ncbi:hypothetical protein KSC_069610 [Ktedonobacter sp. SOSP1-52]|uniref:peptidoglycan recognition protein family protein n=1 Tax=Ktedonobacter sp. SOSP1-52 TaxID=2778366 RepID=UPI001916A591|nr:N-acetylmuramoyl-L-alanine amidase [Ktedonobacter sp. SOSP1-52]GHO68069.1 hypothetical protein KSC_069610 [Ktedonobacter sp. SOSP1-52]
MCINCEGEGRQPQPQEIRRRTILKTGLGVVTAMGLGGLQLLTLAPHASAHTLDGAAPEIISCDEWGARPPSSAITVLNKKATKILVHHTAFPNVTDYSRDQAIKLAHDIQNLHMDTNGWIDTGQHFTVSRGGYITEGRHRSLEVLQTADRFVQSAHCPYLNQEAIGIENEGTYIDVLPPEVLWNSLVDLCVYTCQQYGFGANVIFGHWNFQETDCPGIMFYSKFPQLRREVAAKLGQSMPERTWVDLRWGVRGDTVRALQYVLRAQGSDVVISGTYDDPTYQLVTAFQRAKGITPDGYTRNDTWEALVGTIRLDNQSQGDYVNAVQVILKRNGYDVTVNGQYDYATMKAVKQVQSLHLLPPTGKVDLDAWCAIIGGVLSRG